MPSLKIVAPNRVRLPDHVAAQLMELISQRVLKTGDALPAEAELARRFGVSKAVIREALSQLATGGMITIQQGRPSSVAALSSEPLAGYLNLAVRVADEGLREAIELRQALETDIAMLAARRATPSDLAEIGAIVERMKRDYETLDPWIEADVEFHLALGRASHNSLMSFLMEALSRTMRECVRDLQVRQELRDNRATLERHLAIHEALLRRDPEGARAAMQAHFAASRAVVDVILEERRGR